MIPYYIRDHSILDGKKKVFFHDDSKTYMFLLGTKELNEHIDTELASLENEIQWWNKLKKKNELT